MIATENHVHYVCVRERERERESEREREGEGEFVMWRTCWICKLYQHTNLDVVKEYMTFLNCTSNQSVLNEKMAVLGHDSTL